MNSILLNGPSWGMASHGLLFILFYFSLEPKPKHGIPWAKTWHGVPGFFKFFFFFSVGLEFDMAYPFLFLKFLWIHSHFYFFLKKISINKNHGNQYIIWLVVQRIFLFIKIIKKMIDRKRKSTHLLKEIGDTFVEFFFISRNC